MKRTGLFLFLIWACFLFSSPPSGQAAPKVVVWDLAPRNINPDYARELTAILVSELAKLKKFEVYSQENVRAIAGWTAERMKLGCTDTQCLLALGQMDIAKLISGSVGKIGNRYSVSLSLFNTQDAKAEEAISEFCRTEDELIDLVQHSARKLLGISGEPARTAEKAPAEKARPQAAGAPQTCEAPKWKMGDNWTFRFADRSTRRQKVVEEDQNFYYVETDGGVKIGVEKKSMNIVFQMIRGGKKENVPEWRTRFFNFPLHVGKTWNLRYATADGESVNEYRVEKVEDIPTSAGSFQCFKVNFEQRIFKRNVSAWTSSGWIDSWYSPQAKTTVKRDFRGPAQYWGSGPWQQDYELMHYELK